MLAARPTVAVEAPSPDPFVDASQVASMVTLRGWLVRRLLEEGYDVAADPAGAHGVVRLRPASDGLVVEAEGEGRERRSFAVEGGPDAVMRLEVLHRALMGVEQTCDATEALAAPEPGLALRFVGGTSDAALLEAVAVVADDARVTLTTRPQPGDTVLCVERRGSLAEVSLGSPHDECGPPLSVIDLGDGSVAAHRQAAQVLVDSIVPPANAGSGYDDGRLDTRSLGGPPAGDPMPAPDVVVEDDGLVPMHGPPRAEMRLGMNLGVAARGSNVDPLIQAGWRMGKIRGLGGRLSLSFVPSRGGSIRVTDSRLVIGPDWQLGAGKRGHIELALLVGTDLHTFANRERTAGDVAFAAELPVSYAFTLRKQSRIHLAITPGLTTTSWEHRRGLLRDNEVEWSRPFWRIGVAVGITHGWRIE